MSAIFLSASVPVVGRGNYYETADPFLIQTAVRELVIAVIRDFQIVWGGHPAITPMIWTICQDLDLDYSRSVILYQSRFFEYRFPEENQHFQNVIFIDKVEEDREASLLVMRKAMLSRHDLNAAVFIGGMEGVKAEYELFREFHPEGKVLPVPATGGAARELAEQIGGFNEETMGDVNFARLFRTELGITKDKREWFNFEAPMPQQDYKNEENI
jgi:SLOG-like protein